MNLMYLQAAFVLLVAFGLGFFSALGLTGYGVLGGLRHIIALWRYRTGRCQCHLCRAQRLS